MNKADLIEILVENGCSTAGAIKAAGQIVKDLDQEAIDRYRKAMKYRDESIEDRIDPAVWTKEIVSIASGMEGEKVPNLSGLDKSGKDEFIKEFVEMTAKNVLSVFVALGLKTHLEVTVDNDADGNTYQLSFLKKQPEGSEDKFDEIWNDCQDDETYSLDYRKFRTVILNLISHPQPISEERIEEPLNEVTLELEENKVNELLEADVLLIGGIKWYKNEIVTEALAQYAKKKIKEQSHHPQPISEGEIDTPEVTAIMLSYAKENCKSVSRYSEELEMQLKAMKWAAKWAINRGVKPMSEERIDEIWKKHRGHYNVIFNRRDFGKFLREFNNE